MSFDDSHDPLGLVMQSHLSRRLDPELGKAAARFASEAMRTIPAPSPRSAARGWIIGMVATGAVAALVAFGAWIFVYGFTQTNHKAISSVKPVNRIQTTSEDDSPPVERTVFWRTLDEGTVFIDNDTPARQLRRQQVEQVTWTDQETGEPQTSYSVPKEEVLFVAYDRY